MHDDKLKTISIISVNKYTQNSIDCDIENIYKPRHDCAEIIRVSLSSSMARFNLFGNFIRSHERIDLDLEIAGKIVSLRF